MTIESSTFEKRHETMSSHVPISMAEVTQVRGVTFVAAIAAPHAP